MFLHILHNNDCLENNCVDQSLSATDEYSFNYNNITNAGCFQPQEAGEIGYSYSSVSDKIDSTFGKGSLQCNHRRAVISMTNTKTSVKLPVIQKTIDTLNIWTPVSSVSGSNTEYSMEFDLPVIANSSIDCGEWTFSVCYPDAAITSGFQATGDSRRCISCGTKLTYGPVVTGIAAHYIYPVDGVDIIYGWGYSTTDGSWSASNGGGAMQDGTVTITGSDFTDPFFADFSFTRRVEFSSVVANILPASSDSVTIAAVPPSTWDKLATITHFFRNPSGTVKCLEEVSPFHYGPEVVSSSRDDCVAPVPATSR